MKREDHAREYLDGPLPAPDLAESLADIERLNERFGGHLPDCQPSGAAARHRAA